VKIEEHYDTKNLAPIMHNFENKPLYLMTGDMS
jgi:hypothetical protein